MPGQASAANRPAHVAARVERLRQQRDRATVRRRRDLPQGNGHERPCGIPVVEETRLPAAGARRLRASDAPEVRAGREGYRPGRGAGEAV